MKTDLFHSCGHCWVFQICWCIECSTFTASSFRIWNSSTRIPSPPLAFFVVMLLRPTWLHILEEISSLSHSVVFLYFFALITEMRNFFFHIQIISHICDSFYVGNNVSKCLIKTFTYQKNTSRVLFVTRYNTSSLSIFCPCIEQAELRV